MNKESAKEQAPKRKATWLSAIVAVIVAVDAVNPSQQQSQADEQHQSPCV